MAIATPPAAFSGFKGHPPALFGPTALVRTRPRAFFFLWTECVRRMRTLKLRWTTSIRCSCFEWFGRTQKVNFLATTTRQAKRKAHKNSKEIERYSSGRSISSKIYLPTLGPVTPTQIFLSCGPELLYTILNVKPKLQPSKWPSSLCPSTASACPTWKSRTSPGARLKVLHL